MVRLTLDPSNLPRLSVSEKALLDSMSEAEITAAAEGDADNPPLTEVEHALVATARRVRAVRAQTGISQTAFAREFRINVARLRDLEQGRFRPDSALLAYLAVIDKAPDVVRRVLGGG